MYPDFNYATHVGGWNNPLASTYAQPIAQHLEDLAKQYPVVSSWIRTGRVSYFDRSITFIVPAGQTIIQAFNVSGGFDCLVFDRKASVTLNNNAPANILPNEEFSYCTMTIARQAGSVDTEQAPVANNMGFGWDPNDRPQIPEFWSGGDVREFTFTNNLAQDLKVVVTFTLVLL